MLEEETTEDIVDPTKIMDGLSNEIANSVDAIEKAQSAEEKLMHSEIIKNLSESFNIFFNIVNDMALYSGDEEDEPSTF